MWNPTLLVTCEGEPLNTKVIIKLLDFPNDCFLGCWYMKVFYFASVVETSTTWAYF